MDSQHAAEQIHAGLALISLSHLATWDGHLRKFHPTEGEEFARATHAVDPTYGRLMSWLTFAVGSEYLLKGICAVCGLNVDSGVKTVLRAPERGAAREAWVKDVVASVAATDKVQTYVMFKALADRSRTIPEDVSEQDFVWTAMKLLGETIRNRDAHQYMRNVRSAQFHAVADVFIPAFEILLREVSRRAAWVFQSVAV